VNSGKDGDDGGGARDKGCAHRDGDGGGGRAGRDRRGRVLARTTGDVELGGLRIDNVDVSAINGVARRC